LKDDSLKKSSKFNFVLLYWSKPKIHKSRYEQIKFKKMASYWVKYTYNNNHVSGSAILTLKGGTESEAIANLKQQGRVPKDANVIILSIDKN